MKNREIKFRAWDTMQERMFKPEFELIAGEIVELVGFEFMQCTGLKDKNDKEIYEGDIVKYIRANMYCPSASFHNKDLVSNVEIYWDEERNAMSRRTIDLTRKNQPPYSSSGYLGHFNDERADKCTIEIIGNIYENKELLK